MKTLTMIEMEGCPYCENREPAKTQPFAGQYYYVPSIFMDGEKLYEAQPGHSYDKIYAEVKRVFDAARAD